LQTLTEIASERNSTIVFPIPIEMLQALAQGLTSLTPPPSASSSPPGES
jgi:hypothetical protein